MLCLITLYLFPLYKIPDWPLERYAQFLFHVIPDSVIPISVIPNSSYVIPDSVIPDSVIPDSNFARYTKVRYDRFPRVIFVLRYV